MVSHEDNNDEEYVAIYANGHWVWDDQKNQLKFVNDFEAESQTTATLPAAVLGPVEFKEDLDVIEQQRFRKKIQRKVTGPEDIVMLQDVKDLVLYLTPMTLLSLTLVKVLHTPTTERFLRALILYCQYYLQVSDYLKTLEVMEQRTLELETQIPTDNGKTIELLYQENLNDLRLLVAKEYCSMLLGTNDFRKYHHKGKDKKLPSLSKKDTLLYEPLIRISVQIVWIALARKQYSKIELEINRLFRSKKFNLVAHNLIQDFDEAMTVNKRQVLRGECLNLVQTLHVHSPFYNEVKCNRNIDFKMLGLGIVKYPKLDERLNLLESLLIMPETEFPARHLNLGIIGLKRDRFDPMLREILVPTDDKPTTMTISSAKSLSISRLVSRTSIISKKRVPSGGWGSRFYPHIYLPEKRTELQPLEFIAENQTQMASSTQQKKWLALVTQRNGRRTRSISRSIRN